ncbi:MAG: hypothetical protein MUC87_07645 [Bacteroidia bacterium]|jgi:hypothetical protein|nr:hypothetical protein [Bacteroidia bacterium]
MSGSKNIINNTSSTIVGSITPRIGSNPGQSGPPVTFEVAAGDSKLVQYGNDQNPFMNTLDVSSKTDGSSLLEGRWDVISRGGFVDDLFNTNRNITVTQAKTGLLIDGSN